MTVMLRPQVLTFALLAATLPAVVHAQPPSRRATTVEAIRTYPGFFNAQLVTVIGRVTLSGEDLRLTTDAGSLRLVGREKPSEGDAELRGVIYDIGRMNSDDPRLLAIGAADVMRRVYGDQWPKPGEELVLSVTSAGPPLPAVSSRTPPIRRIALDPAHYEGTEVSLVGQFRGRNLFADLPDAPAGTRDDFVLRSGDASVWVTGLRPRGKDFNFNPARRVDAGQWVRVTGTVRQGRGLVWLEGRSIELADAPTEDLEEITAPPPPPPPLDVVFTAPTDGEVGVQADVIIRIQFSRDLAPATLPDHVRLSYLPGGPPGMEAQPGGPIAFTTNWTPVNRGLEIRPAGPLTPFRQVRVELTDGIRGPDGATLRPFTFTFSTAQ